ncbi:unnamed protein product [Prorocentrum cordatum]|uniref:Uncharacterized protein n=1 Tax=Prorocentrum cordatum TaxID=2364126 RepID=A0ABN9X5U9_9DINO|nr:unnamed protein product [Polarella glacialis]
MSYAHGGYPSAGAPPGHPTGACGYHAPQVGAPHPGYPAVGGAAAPAGYPAAGSALGGLGAPGYPPPSAYPPGAAFPPPAGYAPVGYPAPGGYPPPAGYPPPGYGGFPPPFGYGLPPGYLPPAGHGHLRRDERRRDGDRREVDGRDRRDDASRRGRDRDGERGGEGGAAKDRGKPAGPPAACGVRVSGCQHETVGTIVNGEFDRVGENHSRPYFRRKEKANDGSEVMLYFWDDPEPKFAGWWFGPKVGGDQVWAYQPSKESREPPETGWQVPYDGPVEPNLRIQPTAGRPEDDQQLSKQQRRDRAPKDKREENRRNMEQASKTRAQQQEEIKQKLDAERQRVQDELRRKLEEQQKQAQQQIQAQKDAEERRRLEVSSVLKIRRCLEKLKVASPEGYEGQKRELEDVMLEDLDKTGAQKNQIEEECARELEASEARVKKIVELHRELGSLVEEAEAGLKSLQDAVASLDTNPEQEVSEVNEIVGSITKADSQVRARLKCCADYIVQKGSEIKDASPVLAGQAPSKTQQELASMLQRVHVCTQSSDASVQESLRKKDAAIQRARAWQRARVVRRRYEKYCTCADKLLRKKDVAAYSRGEFDFALSTSRLEEIWRLLVVAGEKGIRLERMPLLTSAIGIHRESQFMEGAHLALLGADWNFGSTCLEMPGMPRRAGLLIMQPESTMCVTPQAKTKIYYFLASTAFSKLVQVVNVDSSWAKRPHRPVQLHLRPGAVKMHQLVYTSHQRLPAELPVGPSNRSADWTKAREQAEHANLVASDQAVGTAWTALDVAWKAFSNAMELELESKLDTPVRRKGKKGPPLVAQWASVLAPPQRKEEDEVRVWVGWVWLQQNAKDLLNTSQRLVVQMSTLVDQSDVQASVNFCREVLDSGDSLHDGLKMLRPIDSWPSPSDEHAPVLYDEDGQPVEWSQFNSTGLYQAAEQLQLALLPIFVPRLAHECCSDCMNAVKLHNKGPLEQLSPKQRYGGLRRGALIHTCKNKFAPAVHAPAHRKLEVIDALAQPERRIGQANWRAYLEAKKAIELHARPSDAEAKQFDWTIDQLRKCARLMASALPLFPRATHQRSPRRVRPTKVFDKATSLHSWQRSLRGFRRTKCLVFSRGRQRERPELGCEGFLERVAELLVSAPDHGHKLASTQVGDEAAFAAVAKSCPDCAEGFTLCAALQSPALSLKNRYYIADSVDQFRQWLPLACDCAPDLTVVHEGLHANPGATWRAIIETGTLSPPSLPVVRSDGQEWSRIPLRVGPECRAMHYGGNHWVCDNATHSPGDRCVGYQNTRLESLIHPATAWNEKQIGRGILKDGRPCYGVCTHHGNSGVNVYSDGGLETFHGSQGWVQLEVEVRDTTKLKDGRINRYCVKGTPFETCEKVVLEALWVPRRELPSIVCLS